MKSIPIALSLASSISALAQPVPRTQPQDPLAAWNSSIDALTRKVWPSVVQILATALTPRLRIVNARIVGLTTELDLALLKVDDLKLPPLPLARTPTCGKARRCSPSAARPNSATASRTDWCRPSAANSPESPLIYVQTDAPINSGNSAAR